MLRDGDIPLIPGLDAAAEARLLPHLGPAVTDGTPERYAAMDFTIFEGTDPALAQLGISVTEGAPMVVLTDPARPVGRVRMACGGADTLLFIDNRAGSLDATIRTLGPGACLMFNGSGGSVHLPTVFMRSTDQFLFWGMDATAVECSIEMEGDALGVVVGDDALIANGVWIRNHDMHALHDLDTGAQLNRPAVTTVLERHVWLAQDSLLLGCERIGRGSVIGARALVRTRVPACVTAAGSPARILRTGVSWGRDLHGISDRERDALRPIG